MLRLPRRRRLAKIACMAAAVLIAAPAAAFDLQGHRGARGLAPENTLPAFATALGIGVSTLEFDVGISADGAVVVAHDRRLNPDITKDADGNWIAAPAPLVHSLPLAALQRFDVGVLKPGTDYARQFATQTAQPGTRMPTLGDVAALAAKANADHVRFNIETKISPLAADETVSPEIFAQTLIDEIRRLDIGNRATIQSFDWRTLAHVASAAPEIARVYLTFERNDGSGGDTVGKGRGVSPWTGLDAAAHGNSTPRLVAAAGGKVWSPFFRNLSAETMEEAKRLGLTVVPWTVNATADIDAMLALGVDGIITDYPDRLRARAAARGLPLPPPRPVAP
ncbi:MAG: glycerophosphodiester phosphodiesterase [Telmatospirillum sp.]|nr:glycerophosphodiester phosphodiesterase [Telmatospirillum sp.]